MGQRTSSQIKQEIVAKFGFFPPFFEPAFATPGVLESLWQQTLAAYLENPIPALFKEKLAASIARFCTVPYCLLCHSSSLRPLGMKASEVLTLLQEDPLNYAELARETKKLESQKLTQWPEAGSEIETGIYSCCLAIFLNQDTEDCQVKLRNILPTHLYDYLNLFLSYNKTCLAWAEAHPELNYESDKRVQDHYASMVLEDPKLEDFFDNYRGRAREQTARREQWLTQENKLLVNELKQNQEWLSATLHGIGDAVIATDAEKNPSVIYLNGVAEELTGWSQAEAKGMPVEKVFNIISSKTRSPATNPIATVIASGKVQGLANHTVLIRRDKVEFHIEDSAAPIRNADGQVQGVVLIFRDVTAEKSMREMAEQQARDVASERDNLLRILEANPSPNVLWRTDDLIFERVSPSYQALFPRKVLIGNTFREILPEKEYEQFFEILRGVFRTGNSVTMPEQEVLFDIDGKGMKARYYTLSFFQIKAADGQPYGVYQQAVDVTEQILAREVLKSSAKSLEEERAELAFERQKLATVIANSTASIAVLRGESFIYELTNKSYAELFSNRELVGKPLVEALPELADQPFPKHAKSVFETGVPYIEREARALLKRTEDSPLEERFFDQIYSQILDQKGKSYGIFIHAQEVTDRVVSRRELEIAKATAEHSNQTKSSFLANMSHEIRTPLGAILGFTDLLRERNLDSKDREQFLDTISRNGKALTKIIDDILDLAKVESGKLETEMIDFSLIGLIDEVMDLFRERTHSKQLYLRTHFEKNTSQRVISDPTRLRQILINVVGNAVKFTNEGGVTIDVRHEQRSDKKVMLIISVKDTGVGLTSEQKERLFQPFMQADNSTTRKFGGTGLGLSLSQRLAQALGGGISIEDDASQNGCTFKISVLAELPKAAVPTTKQHKSSSENTVKKEELPLQGIQILVADDSKDNQVLIKLILTKFGANVTMADNGIMAVRKGIEGSFDIVLMDIQMPEMDGYEATRALREAGFSKPIIALTAHAMAEERARTAAAGCNGHLTKPLDQTELLETIARHAKSKVVQVPTRNDH